MTETLTVLFVLLAEAIQSFHCWQVASVHSAVA